MRKSLLVVLTTLTFCAFAAFAQDNPTSPPSSASPPAQAGSQTSTPQSAQAGSQTAAGEQTIEGCIVRQATTYFIQPASGPPEKLSESPDVAKNEGSHVVVHGTEQSSSASNAANPESSPAATGQPSSAEPTFNVTRVDTVETNCPDSMKGKSKPPE